MENCERMHNLSGVCQKCQQTEKLLWNFCNFKKAAERLLNVQIFFPTIILLSKYFPHIDFAAAADS